MSAFGHSKTGEDRLSVTRLKLLGSPDCTALSSLQGALSDKRHFEFILCDKREANKWLEALASLDAIELESITFSCDFDLTPQVVAWVSSRHLSDLLKRKTSLELRFRPNFYAAMSDRGRKWASEKKDRIVILEEAGPSDASHQEPGQEEAGGGGAGGGVSSHPSETVSVRTEAAVEEGVDSSFGPRTEGECSLWIESWLTALQTDIDELTMEVWSKAASPEAGVRFSEKDQIEFDKLKNKLSEYKVLLTQFSSLNDGVGFLDEEITTPEYLACRNFRLSHGAINKLNLIGEPGSEKLKELLNMLDAKQQSFELCICDAQYLAGWLRKISQLSVKNLKTITLSLSFSPKKESISRVILLVFLRVNPGLTLDLCPNFFDAMSSEDQAWAKANSAHIVLSGESKPLDASHQEPAAFDVLASLAEPGQEGAGGGGGGVGESKGDDSRGVRYGAVVPASPPIQEPLDRLKADSRLGSAKAKPRSFVTQMCMLFCCYKPQDEDDERVPLL